MKKVRTLRTDVEMPVIVVPVSSKLIANAVRKDSHRCMIRDALKQRIPKAQRIRVDLQSVRFTDPDTNTRYKYFTPLPGQQALVNFDQGKVQRPFTLTLKDGVKESVARATPRGKTTKRASSRKSRAATTSKQPTLSTKERQYGLCNLE